MMKVTVFCFMAMTIGFSAYGKGTDHSIVLSDGRILSFATYGDSLGFPVFYFHGGQESRLSAAFMDSVATKLSIKLIAPERPGIGYSSPHPNRTFLNWGKDIEELADRLSIDKFSIIGLSGGAPHVLACLSVMSDRIYNTAIVSGTSPDHYVGSRKGMWLPVKLVHWFATMENDKQLRKFIHADYESIKEKPGKRMKQFQKYLPAPDRELMKNQPQYGWEFIRGSLESYRQGIDGIVQEWKLYVRDWGFDLTTIENQVILWYGAQDKMVPKYKGIYLHSIIPNSTLHIMENEGHFSLIRNHQLRIFEWLVPRGNMH